MRLPPVNADVTVQQAFDIIEREWPLEPTYRGEGDPNGTVRGGPGAEYIDLSTGLRWTHEAAARSDTDWNVK